MLQFLNMLVNDRVCVVTQLKLQYVLYNNAVVINPFSTTGLI